MIWQCTEILAVIVECMIVTRMLIQYFKFRSEDYRILKWLLLFSLLFATDMAGTFGMANETFLILSCLLIEIVFSAIFLKGSTFEKVLISIINYVLVYFINLPKNHLKPSSSYRTAHTNKNHDFRGCSRPGVL